MRWALLDTNIYIGHWERGLHEEVLADVRRAFIVRHSSVVLSELRRGARTKAALGVVLQLHKLATVQWEPTGDDWWEAGRLIQKIGDARDRDRNKRRKFQNDALIGLTARRHGATIVTANGDDFMLLAKELKFAVITAAG